MQNEFIVNPRDAERLGLLLPDVAHEIRNLMQSVKGLAELERRAVTGPASIERLNKIAEHAEFTAELMQALLHATTAAQKCATGDIREAVKTAAALIQSDFGAGIGLALDVAADVQPVALSTGFVELILLNICKNAVESR